MSNEVNRFAEIEQERNRLITERTQRIKDHDEWLTDCNRRIRQLLKRENLLAAGLDLPRIDRARKVIEVMGDPTKPVNGSYADQVRTDTRTNAVADAKKWLAENQDRLRERYIGIKNYASFGDQREDHQYGMGPRHGTIVFSIGLVREVRERELTADEVEDALYLLNVLPKIKEAEGEL